MKSRASVATKLVLVLASSITALLAIAAFALSGFLTDKLEQKALESLQNSNRMIIGMFATYNRSLEESVQRLAQLFAANYPQSFSLDASGILRHGNEAITQDNTQTPDRFTALARANATVLTRQGDDFVRTSTSVKDEKGQRASGIPLGSDHPAVAKLIKGEAFTGKAKMLGRDFMTHYIPIKSLEGKVIGAFFVGLDFTEGLTALKQKVLAIKIGTTGYAYAMDMGKDKGRLTIHPSSEGKSLLDLRDANGKDFVSEMLSKKDGITTYAWQNPGESAARQKVVAFNHYPEWNWLVASGSYLDEFNAEGKETGRSLLFLTLMLIPLIVTLVWWSTRRWIAKPLASAVNVAGQVADGDFTGKIDVRSNDEIGQLMHAIGKMQDSLATTIRDIRNVAASVAGDANQLNSAAATVACGSQEQSDAANSMAASVEEMSASINMISQHAEDAQALSNESEKISVDSSSTIEQAMTAMKAIAETVKDSSQTVEILEQEIRAISAIAGVIKDIADQTNLLALNAAIEAARAGEQGRGFAVVADEVRKLAERTSKSTHEIADMITRIEQGTQEAVAKMNRGADEVSEGVALAVMANEAINRIRDGARRVSQAVVSISDAMHEQNIASTTVTQGLETIARMTEANNAEAQNTATAAAELQALARDLHGNVARFKV